MPDTLPTDVKPAGPSSAPVASTSGSNAPVEAASSASQPVPAKDVKEPSMSDLVATVAKKHNIDMDEGRSTPKQQAAEGSVQKLNETKEKPVVDDKQEEPVVEGEEKEKEQTEDEEKVLPESVPYERFKEVNEKANDFKEKFAAAEPVVTAHNQIVEFCHQKGISGEQFKDGLNLLAMVNENPQEAVKVLSTLIEQIQGFVGNRLPEDLQTEVTAAKKELEEGEISQARYDAYVARAKELAQLRATSRMGEQRSKVERQTIQQQQETARLHSLTSTARSWEDNKKQKDPDFRPNSEKYELVFDRFYSLSNKKDANGRYVNVINTADDVNRLLDLAYDQTSALFSKFAKAKKPNGQKILTSTGSSMTAELEPSTMKDLARIVGAKHGIAV